jgi:hypothetical protein
MTRVRFIEHRGVRILHLDFARIKTVEDALSAIAEAQNVITTQPHNSVLTLTDVEHSIFNAEIARALWRLARHDKPYVRAGAVVGLDPAKEIILNLVQRMSRRRFATFPSLEEAKDWLVEHEP